MNAIELHSHLSSVSEAYRFDWEATYVHRSDAVFSKWKDIDSEIVSLGSGLDLYLDKADRDLKKYFVRVAECPFRPSLIRKDLAAASTDINFLAHIFKTQKTELDRFVASLHDNVVLYGGVKNILSLQESFIKRGSEKKSFAIDYNDLVRFRIVCSNVLSIHRVSIEFWQTFFDSIALCKNYYLNPIGKIQFRPYRGIHFIIVDSEGFPTEVQIVSTAREAVGILDHEVIYKVRPNLVSAEAANYVQIMSAVANILDMRVR